VQLPDVDRVDRPRRYHFIQDFNTSRFTVLPEYRGFIMRASFETEGNELKGWAKGRIYRNNDNKAADANILAKSGPLPYLDLATSLDYYDYRSGSRQSLISMNGMTVDMRVNANGFLSLFENLIERKMKDAIVKGIETQWPRIQPALNAALGPALREGLDIPGSGRVRITRLRTEENQTTLCWRTR